LRNQSKYLNQDELEKINDEPAVYLLFSKRQKFRYPRGYSTLYYIGKTIDLKRRLRDHLTNIEKAKKTHQQHRIYEYASAFGCRVTWQYEPRDLERAEKNLIRRFARYHRVAPVANSVQALGRETRLG
jgi:excinuclease UvrABC nuclease subunit